MSERSLTAKGRFGRDLYAGRCRRHDRLGAFRYPARRATPTCTGGSDRHKMRGRFDEEARVHHAARRRGGCGAAAAAWPLAARAQQPERVRRIGVLYSYAETDKEALAHMAAFREELQKTGWTDGHNIRIDYRGALNEESRQRFAKELVALQPDFILSGGTAPTVALLRQTRSIPIIFVNSADPVGSGLATSLARPGGNVTGFINLEPTMASKWLELLKAGCAARGQYRILVQPRNRALC